AWTFRTQKLDFSMKIQVDKIPTLITVDWGDGDHVSYRINSVFQYNGITHTYAAASTSPSGGYDVIVHASCPEEITGIWMENKGLMDVIDIHRLTNLEKFDVRSVGLSNDPFANDLTDITLGSHDKMTQYIISGNVQLGGALDVSPWLDLGILSMAGCNYSSLTLNQHPKLINLVAASNQITGPLNISNCPKLKEFNVNSNDIGPLQMGSSYNQMETFNISENSNLVCSGSTGNKLNISSMAQTLKSLSMINVDIGELVTGGNQFDLLALINAGDQDNVGLTQPILDISQMPELKTFSIAGNSVGQLVLPGANNSLESFDVSNNSTLQFSSTFNLVDYQTLVDFDARECDIRVINTFNAQGQPCSMSLLKSFQLVGNYFASGNLNLTGCPLIKIVNISGAGWTRFQLPSPASNLCSVELESCTGLPSGPTPTGDIDNLVSMTLPNPSGVCIKEIKIKGFTPFYTPPSGWTFTTGSNPATYTKGAWTLITQ
ncbi:MAG: hypothetical protein AB8F95_17350, partial [Bacteroidia bacterium]